GGAEVAGVWCQREMSGDELRVANAELIPDAMRGSVLAPTPRARADVHDSNAKSGGDEPWACRRRIVLQHEIGGRQHDRRLLIAGLSRRLPPVELQPDDQIHAVRASDPHEAG